MKYTYRDSKHCFISLGLIKRSKNKTNLTLDVKYFEKYIEQSCCHSF